MEVREKNIPLWFLAPFVPMVLSQVVRLYQTTTEGWLIWDYSGRVAALLVLAVIPSARAIAFRRDALRTSWWETALWILAVFAFGPLIAKPFGHFVNVLIPHTQLGTYPDPHGSLLILDTTLGLALVAFHEEIVFRRCARFAFGRRFGNGLGMLLATSLLFASYHWSAGIGNIASNFFFGLLAMTCLKRTGALWPIVVAHYLIDAFLFYVLPALPQ